MLDSLQFMLDVAHLNKHAEELMSVHQGKWAAMYKGKLGIGNTRREALAQLGHNNGEAQRYAATRYLDRGPVPLTLYKT
jgi:hypothetical protein